MIAGGTTLAATRAAGSCDTPAGADAGSRPLIPPPRAKMELMPPCMAGICVAAGSCSTDTGGTRIVAAAAAAADPEVPLATAGGTLVAVHAATAGTGNATSKAIDIGANTTASAATAVVVPAAGPPMADDDKLPRSRPMSGDGA